MPYYQDLSPYPYMRGIQDEALILNIGWLSKGFSYTKGKASKEFIDNLWLYCHVQIYATRGLAECEFCLQPRPARWTIKYNNQELKLGSAEIRVFGKNNKIYASPNLIFHYVVDHEYLPPAEFIDAVLHEPLPGTEIYEKKKIRQGWK